MAGRPEQPREQREDGPGVVLDQPSQGTVFPSLRGAQLVWVELGPAGVRLRMGSHHLLTSRTCARVPTVLR